MELELLIQECNFKAVRSSGSGGQHVNKVSTKVELKFSIIDSQILNQEQKDLLLEKLKSRITTKGVLILQCGETRSQIKNKEILIKRFNETITKGLEEEKERIPTKIPKAVIRKRIENKRKQSEKKKNRKKPDLD